MAKANNYKVTKPSAREITLTRTFDAPRQLVFDAFIRPEMVRRWLYGPEDWPMVQCEIDLRAGGKLRYVWRHKEKGEMGMSGVFKQITPPECIVHTELFDQDWTGGETVVTTTFTERRGRTTLASTVRYSTQKARDGALKTGMIEGWTQGLDRLAGILATAARPKEGTPALTPYLFFDGRCEEALEFYRKALGAEIGMMMRFRESPDPPPPDKVSPGSENKIMHAAFRIGGATVMASDGFSGGNPRFEGFSLSISAENRADAKRKFDALAEGGKVQMPLGETFFAECFGMVSDRFGVSWMILAGPKNV
ncbi:MAG TPA: SRPBCC domain-containing protein [Hyphomicrobiaceae bacterium]|nr:SRPBCC domain-containing protein [Hyphomicrobiaceae bacterium]